MTAVNPEVVQFLLQVAGHLRPRQTILGDQAVRVTRSYGAMLR